MRGSGFISLVALSLVACVSLTAAASDGRATIELRNGSTVRGEVVEKVPGQKIVLQLATGEVRTIAWETIAKVDEQGSAGPPQASPQPPPADGIVVHFAADHPRAALQRRAGTAAFILATPRGMATAVGETWEDVCVAPCDTTVPKSQTLRIAGDGVTPSANFSLARNAKLDVRAGSLGLRVGGVWLASLGLTAAVLGGIFLAVDGSGKTFSSGLTWGLLGGGLVGTAGGVAMIVGSGTKVRDEQGADVGRVAPPRGHALVVPVALKF